MKIDNIQKKLKLNRADRTDNILSTMSESFEVKYDKFEPVRDGSE